MTALASGLPSSVTNLLLIRETSPDLETLLSEARTFFGPSTPWKLIALSDRFAALESATRAAGLTLGRTVPGLLLDPVPSVPSGPPEFTVRPVNDRTSFRDFLSAGRAGFGVPRWIARTALLAPPRTDREGGGPLQLFVGYAHGKPVSTSALFLGEGVSSLSFVSTIPSARHLGYGAAVTWAAIEAGQDQGCTSFYLRSSPMGRPVYERMGFRQVTDYLEWNAPLPGIRRLQALLRAVRTVVGSIVSAKSGP